MKCHHLFTVFVGLLISTLPVRASGSDWQADYARLLKTYVTPTGVRYAEWHGNAPDLQKMDGITEAIAHADLSKMNTKQQLAFYLNAYNASILDKILHKYPTGGPLAGNPLFFFTSKITVAGKSLTFDTLEQKIIRPQFKEPRVHFALNCASKSCPPLSASPFSAADLDRHLDELARAFCNSRRAVQLSADGHTAELSKIFDWYQKDFQSAGGVVPFINRYREKPLREGVGIRFSSYDWSLNESR